MFDALARLAPTRHYDVLALLDRLAARRGRRSDALAGPQETLSVPTIPPAR
jgi:hypothetical protein